MNMRHILVCEADEELIRRMHGEAIVVRTGEAGNVGHFSRVIEEDNKVHCIEYTTDDCIAEMPIQEDWKDVPMHVMSPSLGNFMDFIVIRPMLKDLKLRCFLDASVKENYTDLQIMTSLGIAGGLWFRGNTIPWEEFNDLMTYSIYPKVYRADIEPFAYILRNYGRDQSLTFPVNNFDNPMRYLHVDKEENVALTAEKLKNGEYLFQGLSNLDDIQNCKPFLDWKKKAHKPFMNITTCGSCPAWRICGGSLAFTLENNPGCRAAMEELFDAAVLHKKQRTEETKEVELCQL